MTAIGGASGAHALDASIDHCLSEAFGPRRPSRWVNRERPKIDRIARFGLDDPGLAVLALIVRGANTDRHDLAPKAAGLHALSFGLALTHTDDPVLLAQELVLYDALYAWAVEGQGERHAWRLADIQTNTQEERLK